MARSLDNVPHHCCPEPSDTKLAATTLTGSMGDWPPLPTSAQPLHTWAGSAVSSLALTTELGDRIPHQRDPCFSFPPRNEGEGLSDVDLETWGCKVLRAGVGIPREQTLLGRPSREDLCPFLPGRLQG